MARLARRLGERGVLLPAISADEAALVEGLEVRRVDSLDRAARFLAGEIQIAQLDSAATRTRAQTPPRAMPPIFPKSMASTRFGARSKSPSPARTTSSR